MPADLNQVALVGRLARDGELRHLPSGDAVHALRLAVTARAKEGGQWTDRSNYFDVTVFGREGLASYLTKGSRIGITGRLSWREWQAKDGSKRQAVEVVASDVQLLDGRGDDASGRVRSTGVGDEAPF
jgi:single-strand DNA-binding protein